MYWIDGECIQKPNSKSEKQWDREITAQNRKHVIKYQGDKEMNSALWNLMVILS